MSIFSKMFPNPPLCAGTPSSGSWLGFCREGTRCVLDRFLSDGCCKSSHFEWSNRLNFFSVWGLLYYTIQMDMFFWRIFSVAGTRTTDKMTGKVCLQKYPVAPDMLMPLAVCTTRVDGKFHEPGTFWHSITPALFLVSLRCSLSEPNVLQCHSFHHFCRYVLQPGMGSCDTLPWRR